MRLDLWQRLTKGSNRPEVQQVIAALTCAGLVRVEPMPDDPTRVRVIGLVPASELDGMTETQALFGPAPKRKRADKDD